MRICKGLDSMKSFFCCAPQLSEARILSLSPVSSGCIFSGGGEGAGGCGGRVHPISVLSSLSAHLQGSCNTMAIMLFTYRRQCFSFTYVSSLRGHKDVTQDPLLINTTTQSESLERFRN